MKSSAFSKISDKKKKKNLMSMIKFHVKNQLTNDEIEKIVSNLNLHIQYKIQVVPLDGMIRQMTFSYNIYKEYDRGHEFKNITSHFALVDKSAVYDIHSHESEDTKFFKMKMLQLDHIRKPLVIYQEVEYSKMVRNENIYSIDNNLLIYLPHVVSLYNAG